MFNVLIAALLVMLVSSVVLLVFKDFHNSAYASVSSQRIVTETSYEIEVIKAIGDINSDIDNVIANQIKAQEEAMRIEEEKRQTSQVKQTPKASAASQSSTPKASTITINGIQIPYKNAFGVSYAPTDTAGLWEGSDSVSDGSYGYFIGHNPGLFKDVPSLRSGSQVSVCDSTGAYQVYQVIDVFDVSRDTYLHQIEDRISGYGESIVIQTCLPNAYRVVVAQSI